VLKARRREIECRLLLVIHVLVGGWGRYLDLSILESLWNNLNFLHCVFGQIAHILVPCFLPFSVFYIALFRDFSSIVIGYVFWRMRRLEHGLTSTLWTLLNPLQEHLQFECFCWLYPLLEFKFWSFSWYLLAKDSLCLCKAMVKFSNIWILFDIFGAIDLFF